MAAIRRAGAAADDPGIPDQSLGEIELADLEDLAHADCRPPDDQFQCPVVRRRLADDLEPRLQFVPRQVSHVRPASIRRATTPGAPLSFRKTHGSRIFDVAEGSEHHRFPSACTNSRNPPFAPSERMTRRRGWRDDDTVGFCLRVPGVQ